MPATETAALPDKPSELIRVALADFDQVTADARFKFDIGSWMERQGIARKCSVCLAGAVIAKTLGGEIRMPARGHFTLYPIEFDDGVERKLKAISSFAFGQVGNGLDRLGITFDARSWPWREHDIGHLSAFRADMEKLAADLAAAGL